MKVERVEQRAVIKRSILKSRASTQRKDNKVPAYRDPSRANIYHRVILSRMI